MEMPFLLDSGADFSMIPRELADDLGLDVEGVEEADTLSVGHSMKVAVTTIKITLKQHGREFEFEAPCQVPKNAAGFPALPLLGREPLFALFDVFFREGYTEKRGKFVLHRVDKKRPAERYRVGGKPL